MHNDESESCLITNPAVRSDWIPDTMPLFSTVGQVYDVHITKGRRRAPLNPLALRHLYHFLLGHNGGWDELKVL
jgi:hypothetical protein